MAFLLNDNIGVRNLAAIQRDNISERTRIVFFTNKSECSVLFSSKMHFTAAKCLGIHNVSVAFRGLFSYLSLIVFVAFFGIFYALQ